MIEFYSHKVGVLDAKLMNSKFAIVVGGTLALDQLTKLYIQHSMGLRQSIPLIRGVLHLTYRENPGAALGLFAYKTNIFIVVGVVAILAILTYVRHKLRDGLAQIALALVLGGACGNLIDRIRLGSVIDFVDFRVWPVFNFADVAIYLGILMLVFAALRAKRKEKECRLEP